MRKRDSAKIDLLQKTWRDGPGYCEKSFAPALCALLLPIRPRCLLPRKLFSDLGIKAIDPGGLLSHYPQEAIERCAGRSVFRQGSVIQYLPHRIPNKHRDFSCEGFRQLEIGHEGR